MFDAKTCRFCSHRVLNRPNVSIKYVFELGRYFMIVSRFEQVHGFCSLPIGQGRGNHKMISICGMPNVCPHFLFFVLVIYSIKIKNI